MATAIVTPPARRCRHHGIGGGGFQKRQPLCGFPEQRRSVLPELDRLGVGTRIVAALPGGTRQPLVRNHPVMPGRQSTTELHGTRRPGAIGNGLIVTHNSLLVYSTAGAAWLAAPDSAVTGLSM